MNGIVDKIVKIGGFNIVVKPCEYEEYDYTVEYDCCGNLPDGEVKIFHDVQYFYNNGEQARTFDPFDWTPPWMG